MNLLLMWMQQLVVTLTSHQKEVIKLLYQTSGLVILNNIHINYTLYLFLIAEKVLLNSNSLSYCPLKDTFDEYTSDCWTYDGR